MKAVLFAIVLAACGGSPPPPTPPVSNTASVLPADAAVDAAPGGMAEVFAKISQFADQMCACADRACAERVSQQMNQWAQEMAKSDDGTQKVSEADTKRMSEVAERLSKCVTDVYMKGTGSGAAP